METNIAELHDFKGINENYRLAIIDKLINNQKVKDSIFFKAIVAPHVLAVIKKHSMEQYVLNLILLNVNENGRDSKQLKLVRSKECIRLTTDPGDGFPDLSWKESIWHPFIDDLLSVLRLHYIMTHCGPNWCYVNRLHKQNSKAYRTHTFIS